jgi:HK97 family phage portal protein
MIFNKIEKREVVGEAFDWTSWVKGEDFITENALKEQNYLAGLNILGNTIAKLPLVVKQTTDKGEIEAEDYYLYDLLRLRPNSSMNTFQCLKSLVMLYKHNGASGLFIDRDFKGKVKGLYPCKILQFTIDNVGLIKSTKENKVLIDFECAGVQGSCFDKDMIILRDNSLDGINSKSTKSYIKDTFDTNLQAQAYQKDLFANGLTNKAVVQFVTDEKDEKELRKAQDKFNRLYSSKGRIFTVPVGFNVQPLNLSLVDSQFAELKLSGKKDVATALGIPFGLLDNGSITEQDNISYLTNTISPILTQLEQEFDYKVLGMDRKKGYKVRANVNAMLRTSAETQSVILDRYVRDGIYTLNDAKRILGMPTVEGGDETTLPSGQISLSDLILGNATWQKGTNSTKNNNSNSEGGDNNNGK